MKKSGIFLVLIAVSLLSANNVYSKSLKEKDNNKNIKINTLQAKVLDENDFIHKEWWSRFNDPVLNGYIKKTLLVNHDFKIASLKVLESQAINREFLGRELPSINFNSDISRRKTSSNVGMGNFRLPSYTQSSFLFPLTVNYELDLWLKNRQKTLLNAKDIKKTELDKQAMAISLNSLVSSTYFNILNIDKQLELQKSIISIRKEIYDLTKENYNFGLSNSTEVTLAEKSLTEAQSGLYDLQKKLSIYLNQLATLTNSSIDEFENINDLERSSIDNVEIPEYLPKVVENSVIKNRPDILKAETELEQAKINVTLAKKDFLPDITINGQFGFNANSFAKSFNRDSYILSAGTGLFQSIFTGGQRKARLKAQKYKYEQMLENYQKVILLSFQEVNDSLAILNYDLKKNRDNLNRIDNESYNLDSIMIKYNNGAISYLDTLQYQERMLTLRKEQIQSKADCLNDAISLYKSTAGGI